MKVVQVVRLTGVDTVIQFSEAEKRALTRASEIAEQAREKAREIVGNFEWEQDSTDTTLAHVEHDSREIMEDGILLAETFGFPFESSQ